jgi:hypothetical protein
MNRFDREGAGAGLRAEDAPEAPLAFALPRPSRRLAALTSSALALPGVAGNASADAPIERAEMSYAYSFYDEDKIAGHKIDSGDPNRYQIDTHQLRFDVPVAERVDVGVDFLYEKMAGSSPWFVTANGPGGKPLQALSGATIEDERFDIGGDVDFYLENGKDNFSAGYSTERDYKSVHVGLGVERNFNDKNTSVSASGAFSYDWIDPTDPGFSLARPNTGERWSLDLFGGFSQILTRSTTAQITVNYKHSEGYLSDPYKAIQNVDGGFGLLADIRPDMKDQVSILGRLRQHIEPLAASIHLDYRFYADTFKITSHTFELAWYQSIMDVVTITPSVRYYSQSKAEFYDPVLPVGIIPRYRSNDFRLSPYGAISTKLKVELQLVDLIRTASPQSLKPVGVTGDIDLFFTLSYERYLSDGAYAITPVSDFDEAPGLVGFQVFAGTFSGRF